MSENATPPPKQSKDVESSLREQIVKDVLVHDLDCQYSLYDRPCTCVQSKVADNLIKIVTTYIEAAAIDRAIEELSALQDYGDNYLEFDANGYSEPTMMAQIFAQLSDLQAQKAVLEVKWQKPEFATSSEDIDIEVEE